MRDDILGLGYMRMFPQANMAAQTTQTQRSLPTAPGVSSGAASFASQLAQAGQRAAALNAHNPQLLTNSARLAQNATTAQNAASARVAQNARLAQNATRYTSPLQANPNQRTPTPRPTTCGAVRRHLGRHLAAAAAWRRNRPTLPRTRPQPNQ
jgi:hypothetical protein